MRIIGKNDNDAINLAISELEKDNIIAIPTDTIYGLAVRASSSNAVNRLYQLKARDINKPIAIFVPNLDFANNIFELGHLAIKIANELMPGKITIVAKLKQSTDRKIKNIIAKNLNVNNQDFLGFRIPNHDFILNLLKNYQEILAVTSANPSQMPNATNSNKISDYFSNNLVAKKYLNLIIDDGISLDNKPSTVIKFIDNYYQILREGEFSKKMIEEIINSN
jgi:L-threonylcarbamoyladenylate synthase